MEWRFCSFFLFLILILMRCSKLPVILYSTGLISREISVWIITIHTFIDILTHNDRFSYLLAALCSIVTSVWSCWKFLHLRLLSMLCSSTVYLDFLLLSVKYWGTCFEENTFLVNHFRLRLLKHRTGLTWLCFVR